MNMGYLRSSLDVLVPHAVRGQMNRDTPLNPLRKADCMEEIDEATVAGEAANALQDSVEDEVEDWTGVLYLDIFHTLRTSVPWSLHGTFRTPTASRMSVLTPLCRACHRLF